MSAISEWAADAPQPILAALGSTCTTLARVWEAREVLVGLGVELPETDGHDVAGNFLDRRVLMSVPYTHGIWQVKPGRADDFVAAWTEFADWTVQHADGTGWGKLLRDMNDQHRFVSFGPWDSLAAIESWRALEGWNDRVARIRELLVSFEPATLELVVERG